MAEPWQTYLETNNRPLFCLDERMNCVYANRQAVSALNVSGVNDPEWQKIEQAIREHGWEQALLEGPSGSGPLRLQAWPQVENWPLVLEILSDAKIPIERETQWLKYALEASGMGVWSWNQQDNKVLWSEQVEAIFGLKPRTFPGTFDAYCQLVHPADLEMVLQRVQESMAQGKQYTIEHRAVRPDGSIRWIWAVGKVRFDAQGKANGMLGAVLDISPRKHLEAMLALISRSNVESHPQGFFEGLLDLVKQALDCESAIVALSEPSDPPRLKLECGLGIHEKWAGALLPLDAEPWSEVLTQTHLVVAQGAESCGDLLLKEQQAQAFAGVTLIDGDGQILGILAAFSRNPFAQIQTVRILLEVIASRAARDIERAHYLKTLQNQSLLLEITQKTAQIGGWQWDLERERFFWTSETFQIHRIPAGQAPNFEELLRIYTVSSRQLLRYHWQEALETGRAFEIDLELDFKEGSHWVRWRGVPTLKQGEILAFHGSVQDIQKNKLAHFEKDRLVAIIRAMPDCVGICDAAGLLMYLNPAGRQFFGLKANEALNRPLRTYQPDSEYERYVTVMLPEAEREGSWSGESIFIDSAGEEVPVSLTLLAHRDPAGKIAFHSLLIRDLRAKRILETQLLQSSRVEALGRLAGGIAHDFNNLLTSIMGFADLLAEFVPQGTGKSYLEQLVYAIERGASLTGRLLAFARKQVVNRKNCYVNELVKSAADMLGRLLGEDVSLRLELATDIPTMKADPFQFEQVLMNLCLNARDALPQGGEIVVRTRLIEEPNGHWVQMSVIDEGVGMPAEVLEKVYEPFFKTKPMGKGTGLGLAVCHGILSQNKGRIEVTSTVGAGTQVVTYWPLSGESPSDRIQTSELPRFGKERILLVEDEPMIRELIHNLLQKLGYQVTIAENGQVASEIAQAHVFDLIVTDVVMPKMGGLELANLVREQNPDQKILFMSGYTDRTTQDPAFLDVSSFFMAKPFHVNALASMIGRIMEGKEPGF